MTHHKQKAIGTINNNFQISPFIMLIAAVNRKLTKTQIKVLSEEIRFYFDPETFSKDVEISEIALLNLPLWRELLAQMEYITMLFYCVVAIEKFAPDYPILSDILNTVSERKEEINRLQEEFLERLQTEIGKTEDSKMKYLLHCLGRRLFADWVQTPEARQLIANWPTAREEREALYQSMFREGSEWQKEIVECYIKHFDVAKEYIKLLEKAPIYSAEDLKKIVRDLEYLAR